MLPPVRDLVTPLVLGLALLTEFAQSVSIARAPNVDLSDAPQERDGNLDVSSLAPRATGWKYGGSQKVRGVAVGGWLVAEPFITPSLFEQTGDDRVVDEYTMGKYVSDACSRLDAHQSSYITADDFRQIKAAGLNHVRIPIGHWAFFQTGPYCKGNQFKYLTRAVRWARNNGLHVQIDLHTSPHSQNGFDNSGRRGEAHWFNSQDYANLAKSAINTISKRFTASEYAGTVTSIELINEPLTTNGDSSQRLSFTQKYYKDAYRTVRNSKGSTSRNVNVAIQDGFQDLTVWQDFESSNGYHNMALMTHRYSIFNNYIYDSPSDRLQWACNMKSQLATSQQHLPTVVNEWTAVPNDCTKYLNGRGIGSRYDGSYSGFSRQGSCSKKTGSAKNFSSSYKAQLKAMFDTQRSVYETGDGWIYWTWKTESADEWSYQKGLQYGWITRNLNERGSASC